MASLFKPKTKNVFKVQFSLRGRRPTITLGQVTKSRANAMFALIERLIDCRENRRRVDVTSMLLVEELPLRVQTRLREVGLLDQQQALTLGDLAEYILAELGGSPSTVKKRKNVRANAVAYFGADRQLSEIRPGDADDFRRWLRRKGGRGHRRELAQATVSRRCGTLKSWFKIAVRKGWLTQNPMEDQQRESEANSSRQHFVDIETTQKLLDACPDVHFRLVLALARYGGLRCPSEIGPFRWEWVDWNNQVLHVRAPKTKHIDGKYIRTLPIFPELRPYLDAVWEVAREGDTLLFENLSSSNKGMTGRLGTLCRRVGIVLWPKPWQNMRSSRETELVERFPIHVATAWIGNSPAIASRHYLQITKEHIAAALGEPGAAFSPSGLGSTASALQI